ncbi:alpha/beta fold hydrolase [Maricurvus nonylphenolicus]|uniref:alpha/beta hydrolase n=1 Tax=Maricurvus nonylphenolicus TaxID=1008307 RepID=UPI0036F2D0A1
MRIDNIDYSGVTDCDVQSFVLTTPDNIDIYLHRFCRDKEAPPILMIHGLTSSYKMFAGPEWYNPVSYLLDNGFGDVWLLDWRGSAVYGKRYVEMGHNLDDVCRFDIPLAVEHVRANSLHDDIHVIAHCVGSLAFSMALADQQVEGIKSAIIANLGLSPRLEFGSFAKLYSIPHFANSVLKLSHFSVDPAEIDFQTSEYLSILGSAVSQNQCDNPTCRLMSFIIGSGHESTIFKHEHIHPDTHDKLTEYFGPLPISYYFHLEKMMHHSAAVSNNEDHKQRINYLDKVENIDIPMLLCTGKENRCWYDSIQTYYNILQTYYPDKDVSLFEVPDYAHNDLFMGVNSHIDVFPRLLEFLKTQG